MCRRVALITGSAKGLGKKTALDLAANEIDIVINYRKSKAEAQKLVDEIKHKFGVNVMAIQADVSKINDVKNMIESIMSTMGRLDILIHNAGPFIKGKKTIIDTSYEEWNAMVDGNLKSFFILVKEVIPIMRKNKWGRVITFGFEQSQNIPGWIYRGAYAAAKTGVISLTQTLSKEEARFGITFNTVCPGDILGDDKEKNIAEHKRNDLSHFEIQRKEYGEDISRVINFLCEEKSSYITGATISVTGNHDVINKYNL